MNKLTLLALTAPLLPLTAGCETMRRDGYYNNVPLPVIVAGEVNAESVNRSRALEPHCRDVARATSPTNGQIRRGEFMTGLVGGGVGGAANQGAVALVVPVSLPTAAAGVGGLALYNAFARMAGAASIGGGIRHSKAEMCLALAAQGITMLTPDEANRIAGVRAGSTTANYTGETIALTAEEIALVRQWRSERGGNRR